MAGDAAPGPEGIISSAPLSMPSLRVRSLLRTALPGRASVPALLLAPAAAGLAGLLPTALASAEPAASSAPAYAPGRVVVEYAPSTSIEAAARIASVALPGQAASPAPAEASPSGPIEVIDLRHGLSVRAAIARLSAHPGVRRVLPDYIAHAAGATPPAATTESGLPAPFIPENEGASNTAGGWQALQWNFVGQDGVEAPQAWGNLIADGAPGGRGVIVAVLDTGVAYRDWGRFHRSPGFRADEFVSPKDFVEPGKPPVDHNGHGTFVAGEIAEATNVRYGLTGLAYGAKLMPVRVLDGAGEGDATTIAEGIRYAVNHHAQVINMSLEFPAAITAADVPELIGALRYAHAHHVFVAAAAGNDSSRAIPFPARASGVLAIGATTEHGCLADYSNFGRGISLVAPGGGPDADLPGDPNCHPELASGRDIFQVTFLGSSLTRFGIPAGYEGTSMATPEVAATAALVIASGVLGRHPLPSAIADRLKATARPLGDDSDRAFYGAGLLDAAAATAPGGPGAVTSRNSG